MKKKVFIVILIVVFIVIITSVGVAGAKYFNKSADEFLDNASGFKDVQNMTVVATVNGEKIYRETIIF